MSAARDLAAMSRQATDLGGGVPLGDDMARRLQVKAEEQMGMRCHGCGERVRLGFEFQQITVGVRDGQPSVDVASVTACDGRGGCDFALKAKENATVMRPVEFAWLDEPVDGRQADGEGDPA